MAARPMSAYLFARKKDHHRAEAARVGQVSMARARDASPSPFSGKRLFPLRGRHMAQRDGEGADDAKYLPLARAEGECAGAPCFGQLSSSTITEA
jgi:hypothetical protein